MCLNQALQRKASSHSKLGASGLWQWCFCRIPSQRQMNEHRCFQTLVEQAWEQTSQAQHKPSITGSLSLPPHIARPKEAAESDSHRQVKKRHLKKWRQIKDTVGQQPAARRKCLYFFQPAGCWPTVSFKFFSFSDSLGKHACFALGCEIFAGAEWSLY